MFCDLTTLSNESDVEQFFVIPLLGFLGIRNEFIKTKDKIESYHIGKGKQRKIYKPDYIIVIHGTPILIIEAKNPTEKLIDRYFNEAKLYALELNTQYPTDINPVKYCLTTNGEKTYLHKWDQKEEILQLEFSDFFVGSGRLSYLKNYLSFKNLEKEALKTFKIKGGITFKEFTPYLKKIIQEIRSLDKLFIPLKAKISYPSKSSYIRGWRGIIQQESYEKPISDQKNLSDILKEYNRIVILGEAGAGKTTALERYEYENAQSILEKRNGVKLPVFISVNTLSKKKNIENLESYICDLLSISPEQYFRLLSSGNLLIIIDGLNETSIIQREQIIDDIQNLIEKEEFKKNQVIIATRIDSFYPYYDALKLPTVEILKLDDMDIKDYLVKRLGGEESEKCFDTLGFKGLLELVRNPYLLSIMTTIYKKGNEKSLSNRGLLLKEFVNGLLEWEIQKTKEKEIKEIIFKILSCLAYFAIENNDIGKINSSEAGELLQKCYKSLNILEEIKLKEISLSEVQKKLLSTGILQVKNGFWEYHHQLIQEYLASEEILRRGRLGIEKFEDYYKYLKWIQAVFNAIGIMPADRAKSIIENLIDKNIFLASDLWKYTSKPQLDNLEPILVSRLVSIVDNWKEDDISCMQALRSLGIIGTHKAFQHIVRLLYELDDNDFYQRGILHIAAKVAATYQIIEALDSLITLSKNDDGIKEPKIYTYCLASIKTPILEDKLICDLNNSVAKGNRPSWSTLYLLGHLKAEKALPNLINLLHESYVKKNDYIFSYVSYSIYSIDERVIQMEIQKILDSDIEEEWLEKIFYVIGEVKLRRFIPLLLKYLSHKCRKKDCGLSYVALSALEKIENLDDYLNQLLKMLHSNKSHLQSKSLFLINRVTSYNALPEAIKLIKSNDENILWSAYDVIMRSNINDLSEEVINLMLNDLANGSPFRQERAAVACGKLGITKAKKPILNLLKKTYKKLSEIWTENNKEKTKTFELKRKIGELTTSLGELKAEESTEILIKILKETPKWIIEIPIIGEAIKKIGSFKHIKEMEKLLDLDERKWWISYTVGDIFTELFPCKKLEELIIILLKSSEYHHIRHACKFAKKFSTKKIIHTMFEIIEPLYDGHNFNALHEIIDTLSETANISYLQEAERVKKSSKKYLSSIGKHLIHNFHISAGLFPPAQYEIKDI